MIFKPCYSADRWKGVQAILALLLLDYILVRIVTGRSVDGASFILGVLVLVSLPVLGYLAYRTLGIFRLEYWVDRDGVTLVWGPTQQIIPMGDILRIQRGAALQPWDHAERWHWPCPESRMTASLALGPVRCYATRPLGEQIILITDQGNYGLSPADADAFIAALQSRFRLGIARPRQAGVQRSPLWTWELWRDGRALALIGAGLLGVLLMFAALSFRFPALSSDLPLHFDVNGVPDRIAPKSGLFALPMIGLLTWGANLAAGVWVYRKVQRQGAYLFWAGAMIVQIIAGLALFNLMRW